MAKTISSAPIASSIGSVARVGSSFSSSAKSAISVVSFGPEGGSRGGINSKAAFSGLNRSGSFDSARFGDIFAGKTSPSRELGPLLGKAPVVSGKTNEIATRSLSAIKSRQKDVVSFDNKDPFGIFGSEKPSRNLSQRSEVSSKSFQDTLKDAQNSKTLASAKASAEAMSYVLMAAPKFKESQQEAKIAAESQMMIGMIAATESKVAELKSASPKVPEIKPAVAQKLEHAIVEKVEQAVVESQARQALLIEVVQDVPVKEIINKAPLGSRRFSSLVLAQLPNLSRSIDTKAGASANVVIENAQSISLKASTKTGSFAAIADSSILEASRNLGQPVAKISSSEMPLPQIEVVRPASSSKPIEIGLLYDTAPVKKKIQVVEAPEPTFSFFMQPLPSRSRASAKVLRQMVMVEPDFRIKAKDSSLSIPAKKSEIVVEKNATPVKTQSKPGFVVPEGDEDGEPRRFNLELRKKNPLDNVALDLEASRFRRWFILDASRFAKFPKKSDQLELGEYVDGQVISSLIRQAGSYGALDSDLIRQARAYRFGLIADGSVNGLATYIENQGRIKLAEVGTVADRANLANRPGTLRSPGPALGTLEVKKILEGDLIVDVSSQVGRTGSRARARVVPVSGRINFNNLPASVENGIK